MRDEYLKRIAEALESIAGSQKELADAQAGMAEFGRALRAPRAPKEEKGPRAFEDYREVRRNDGTFDFEVLVGGEWVESTPGERLQINQHIRARQRRR